MRRLPAPCWFGSALLLSVLGCVQEEPSFEVAPSGGARVVVVLPRSLAATPVVGVASTATPASGAPVSQEMTGTADRWTGGVERSAMGNTVALRADARDATGAVVASASVDAVALPLYGDALVVLVPQPEPSGAGLDNTAPRIGAVVASQERVAPGDAVDLRVVAGDREGGALRYAWSRDAEPLGCGAEAVCRWTVPEGTRAPEGLALRVRVTDDRGAVSTLQFRLAVGGVGAVMASADERFNRWPQTAPSSSGAPPQVGEGQPVLVDAAARDEDGDALTYAWSASCEGTFDDTTKAMPAFTPTAVPTACACRLTAAVEDGLGGSAQRTVDLCVIKPLPPTLGATSQTAASALAGEVVRFSAAATDPLGGPLTFTWTSNVGAVSPGTAGAGPSSTAAWTSLSCLPDGVTPTVEVTVTNFLGARVKHTFEVGWKDRACGRLEAACPIALDAETVSLTGDCVTEGPVYVPKDLVFDGEAHTVTAVEDAEDGKHFQGAVVRNRGPVAHVRDVTVTARGLRDVCDAGTARLRGILLEAAEGSVEGARVEALYQDGNRSGCQEGTAIEARNDAVGAVPLKVALRNNQVTDYQKGGLVVTGLLQATLEGNRVDGGGPVAHIARNGIQLSYGASARVVGNTVTGNAYQGRDSNGAGLLVVGGAYYGAGRPLCHDLLIQGNTFQGNDIGINLSQGDANFDPPEPQNIQVLENALTNVALTNPVYQAALYDNGSGSLISLNKVDGEGYDPEKHPRVAYGLDLVTRDGERVLAFATPEREVRAGACSPALVVQGRDTADNLAALTDPTVTLAVSGVGATLHLSPDCSDAPVTSASLENAQLEAVVYFRASRAGTLSVTATHDGVSVTQDQTVR